MAVPAGFTTLDMSGKFAMNKELSDSSASDKILELQGVGFIKRKAISALSTPVLTIKHAKNEAGVECIDIQHSIIKDDDHAGEAERIQILDWSEQHKDSRLFGAVVTQARRVKLDQMQDMDVFVREGWTSDSAEHGFVHVKMTSKKDDDAWVVHHVWGVEEVKGERRYVRHIHFIGAKGEEVKAKFVYDYKESA